MDQRIIEVMPPWVLVIEEANMGGVKPDYAQTRQLIKAINVAVEALNRIKDQVPTYDSGTDAALALQIIWENK